MVASIGVIASPSQGASYLARDGYAKEDPAHRGASVWVGRGAAALGISGPVDSDTFTAMLEGRYRTGRMWASAARAGKYTTVPAAT